jgi:hypothetical protein
MDFLMIAAAGCTIGAAALGAWSLRSEHRKRYHKERGHQGAQGSPSKFIGPAPLVRGPKGDWQHPALPTFDEGDNWQLSDWAAKQGLEIRTCLLKDEPERSPAYQAYFRHADPHPGYSAWQPSPPEGSGWFALVVNDTDTGPRWCWARQSVPTQ